MDVVERVVTLPSKARLGVWSSDDRQVTSQALFDFLIEVVPVSISNVPHHVDDTYAW